ncbi:hypothetical protein QBC38DRAFT_235398 [Podospora fimiseda]|uniref:Uncharacterized protein n=1 Tax=Podospora fimiseda TaxID=252190 RepID=A0AAN7BMV4_9PEZI|nr:hypothetical protein QBC38DRAFT_235398 [Podospora fimiseda]
MSTSLYPIDFYVQVHYPYRFVSLLLFVISAFFPTKNRIPVSYTHTSIYIPYPISLIFFHSVIVCNMYQSCSYLSAAAPGYCKRRGCVIVNILIPFIHWVCFVTVKAEVPPPFPVVGDQAITTEICPAQCWPPPFLSSACPQGHCRDTLCPYLPITVKRQ